MHAKHYSAIGGNDTVKVLAGILIFQTCFICSCIQYTSIPVYLSRHILLIFYGISLTIGVFLGGAFGIDTVYSLLIVGMCSNFMMKKLSRN